MRATIPATTFLTMLLFLAAAAQGDKPAGEQGIAAQLAAAKKRATTATYTLRYQLKPGETIRWKVIHLGTTETTIQGNTQTSKSRSVSTKVWKVNNVDTRGNMTFTNSVDSIKMWQKVSDRQEIRYDSQTDTVPPKEYAAAAKTVGVPLATVTISPTGKVIKRDHEAAKTDMGLGEIAVPLPEQPVKTGAQWSSPGQIHVRLPDGRVKRIKTRLRYTLKSVKTGVATIGVDTQVLTPVNDPRIKAQLVQEITNGEIKFDIDAGRLLARQVDWDETVVGFNGSDSLMKYLARYTEQLLPADATARKPESSVR